MSPYPPPAFIKGTPAAEVCTAATTLTHFDPAFRNTEEVLILIVRRVDGNPTQKA